MAKERASKRIWRNRRVLLGIVAVLRRICEEDDPSGTLREEGWHEELEDYDCVDAALLDRVADELMHAVWRLHDVEGDVIVMEHKMMEEVS